MGKHSRQGHDESDKSSGARVVSIGLVGGGGGAPPYWRRHGRAVLPRSLRVAKVGGATATLVVRTVWHRGVSPFGARAQARRLGRISGDGRCDPCRRQASV